MPPPAEVLAALAEAAEHSDSPEALAALAEAAEHSDSVR
jgi:hypothetical protein